MSSTATPLTTDERMAALFALVDEIHKHSKELTDYCEQFLNAKIGEHEFLAREVVDRSRDVARLTAPLNLIIGAAGNAEVK